VGYKGGKRSNFKPFIITSLFEHDYEALHLCVSVSVCVCVCVCVYVCVCVCVHQARRDERVATPMSHAPVCLI